MSRLCILFLIFLGTASWVHAQEVFQGIVVDSATFSPMPYVTVLIKGKGRGAITDTKGNFNIVATRQDTLVLSFVGYESAEFELSDWEPGLIRLAEKRTLLKEVTIRTKQLNPYQGMFDEENAILAARHNKFYYSKAKKEKRKLGWLREDNLLVKTYVEVVVNSSEMKEELMKKYSLTEKQYYDILARFNEKNSQVMYYLTVGELVTLIKNFYARSVEEK